MSNHVKPRATHLHVVPPEGEVPSEDGIPLTEVDLTNIERLKALQQSGVPVGQLIDLRGTYLVALLEQIAGYDGVVEARATHAHAVAEQLSVLEAQVAEGRAKAEEDQRKSILLEGIVPQ